MYNPVWVLARSLGESGLEYNSFSDRIGKNEKAKEYLMLF